VIGSLANGRYTLDRHLATGGMGTVYIATDTALSRTVAIKILKAEYASDRAFRTRFETEARHAAGLDHPGIAKVYDFGETSDGGEPRPYLVMEYVDGQPLSTLLAPGRPLEPERVVDLIAQTAVALQAAHDKGIVHRDVKPANLLITPDAKVKVTDFGIAKAASDTPITQTGTIIGTAHYLPPEQAEGKPATPRSDIYALGVVLYECLAGTRPFVGDNPVAIAISHVRVPPPPLPDTVAPWVAALTMRMLAKDPEQRPASAGELARELRSGGLGGPDAPTSLLAAGAAATDDASRTQVITPTGPLPPVGPEAGPDADAARRRRRLIAAAVIGAIVLLALVIIGAVALFDNGDGADSPEGPTPTTPRDERPNNNNNDNSPNEQPTEDNNNQPTEDNNQPTEEPTSEPTETTEETTEPTETTEETTEPTEPSDTTDETTSQATSEETSETTSEPTTQTTSRRPPSGATGTPDEEASIR
jgi:eukaryotic-like serine/threonine-protein kinase